MEVYMGKIIDFCQARQKLELDGLVSALKWEQNRDKPPEPEKPCVGPTKKPRIISALPGEAMPPEFPDFRPFLQQDGLILIGWSRWDSAPLGSERTGPLYEVNWITSAPGRSHRRYAVGYITEKEVPEAKPTNRAGPYFFQGIHDKPYDFKYVKNEDVADYVFVCAPQDLNDRTIPGFITELKVTGVKVDFDFPFSIDYVKKLEFAAAFQEAKYDGRSLERHTGL
jgi:hypothetical protein